MNRNLKDIAAIAEIDKPITHKVGRHTFATIYLRHTKDLAALKELLGHSDMKETLVYAHVMDESKRKVCNVSIASLYNIGVKSRTIVRIIHNILFIK